MAIENHPPHCTAVSRETPRYYVNAADELEQLLLDVRALGSLVAGDCEAPPDCERAGLMIARKVDRAMELVKASVPCA